MSESPKQEKPPVALSVRPWRRWLKRGALIVFAIVVLSMLSRLVEREWDRVQGERELTRELAHAEKTDPDWTWERLNAARKRPPAGKNAAEVIPQIRAQQHPDWGKKIYSKEWEPRVQQVPPNVRYEPMVLAELRRDLDASAGAVKLSRTLKDYPFGYRDIVLSPNVFDTLLEETQWARKATDLLHWDIALAVEDGDSQRASDDILALMGGCRTIGDEPFHVSQLIRGAIRNLTVRTTERAIAQSERIPNLAQLQAAFAAEAEEPILLYALRGERAVAHQLFENLRTGKTTIHDAVREGEAGTWTRIFWGFKYRGDRAADHARALEYLTMYVEAARLPLEKQASAIERLPVAVHDRNRLMSSMILPKPELFRRTVRSAAMLRCAVVGIACERFRIDHGKWPDTLAALVPDYLAAVPLDPLAGTQLQYEKSEPGVIVYSVGRSGFDDGGTHDDVEPSVSGRVRFRLWNPDQRRLLPRPDPVEPEREPPP